MLSFRIDITRDTATPAIRRLAAGIQPARTAPIIGRSARTVMRDNFFARDQTGNKLGGSRTHFFGQAARLTNFAIEGDSVVVGTTAPIGLRQRYYGGTITPKKSKYLTIPVHPAAYGHRAGEFDLELVFGAGGQPIALATKGNRGVSIRTGKNGKTTKRAVGHMGEIYYRLVRSVTQAPDRSVLPTTEALTTAVRTELTTYLARLTERTGGTASES